MQVDIALSFAPLYRRSLHKTVPRLPTHPFHRSLLLQWHLLLLSVLLLKIGHRFQLWFKIVHLCMDIILIIISIAIYMISISNLCAFRLRGRHHLLFLYILCGDQLSTAIRWLLITVYIVCFGRFFLWITTDYPLALSSELSRLLKRTSHITVSHADWGLGGRPTGLLMFDGRWGSVIVIHCI